jgi:hypothetical protein
MPSASIERVSRRPSTITPVGCNPNRDPYSVLQDLQFPGTVRDRCTALLGDASAETIGDVPLLLKVASKANGDVLQVYLFSFSVLYLASLIGAFARLWFCIPARVSMRRFVADLWENALLPPLCKHNDQAILAAIGQHVEVDLDRDAHMWLTQVILHSAADLREAERLGREVTNPVSIRLNNLVGRRVTAGDLVAPNEHRLGLDLASKLCRDIFVHSGFECLAQDDLFKINGDERLALRSMQHACGLSAFSISKHTINQLMVNLEIEFSKVKLLLQDHPQPVSSIPPVTAATIVQPCFTPVPDASNQQQDQHANIDSPDSERRMADYAIGQDHSRSWVVFAKYQGHWREKRKLTPSISKKTEETLIVAFADGGGILGKYDAIRLFADKPSADVAQKIFENTVKPAMSRLRNKLRTALNLPKDVDPLPWEESSKGWQAAIQVGYAVPNDSAHAGASCGLTFKTRKDL